MKAKLLFDFAKLLLGFGVLWAAFVYLPDVLPERWKPDLTFDGDGMEVSIEQEEKLGEFLLENMMGDMEEVEHSLVDSAMWVINARLLQQIDSTDYDYHIRVVRSEQVNAITLPGGNIIVFSGLLSFAETPEEVAAVLAHEMGHVEKRHVIQKLARELGLTFIISVITGGDATLIHELTRTLISAVFSRSQEAEADDFGMQLLLKSSIDPRALAAFFRKLNHEHMDYNEYLEWLMSHPHNNARIKASLEFEVPKDFVSQPIEVNWERVQMALN